MNTMVPVILSIAADALLRALVDNTTADLYDKLKGDPVKKAFKEALGAAIQRYATGERLVLARALLDLNSILKDKEVMTEISKILSFRGIPNFKLIGNKWKSALNNQHKDYDFTAESKMLVSYLENELRDSEVFRPVFEARDLNAIAIGTEQSTEVLVNIETQLDAITELLNERFGELLDAFSRPPHSIRDQIIDFSNYIAEKTYCFVGRKWAYNAIDQFIYANSKGYFFIIGDPGIGKSALAAQIVKQNGYFHHFNIRAEGINTTTFFLKNLCAQLIAAYELSYASIPLESIENAGFLNKLLNEVSKKLEPGERCIIVVDALDEADIRELAPGINPLYMPSTLPEGIYFIVTMRADDGRKIKPRVECEQSELVIYHDSSDNLLDIDEFLQRWAYIPGIQKYIKFQNIKTSEFITIMAVKSEGNFMYLRYVLPEIERGSYKDLHLDAIPIGLKNYYEDHWQRMRGQDENAWFSYKLPIIVSLTAALEPISIDLISEFSKVKKRSRIQAVLQGWAPFLHKINIRYNGEKQLRYRLYHISFFQFVSEKQEILDERVDLIAMHRQISDILCNDMFNGRL